MSRWEALALLVSAFSMITGGVTWLFGAWGLVGAGTFLAVFTLFVANVKGDAPDA